MSMYTKSGIRLPADQERRPGTGRRRSLTMGLGALVNTDGTIAWQEDEWQLNALDDEGEQDMLSVYLLQTGHLTKYLALINGTTTAPVETSTLTYMAGGAGAQETQVPTANGYNRLQITNAEWTTPALVSTDYQSIATEKTFGPATAAWTISHAALVTALTSQSSAGGKFLLHLALSANTTVGINQSFKYILKHTQQ
jgi:hypothetical protein